MSQAKNQVATLKVTSFWRLRPEAHPLKIQKLTLIGSRTKRRRLERLTWQIERELICICSGRTQQVAAARASGTHQKRSTSPTRSTTIAYFNTTSTLFFSRSFSISFPPSLFRTLIANGGKVRRCENNLCYFADSVDFSELSLKDQQKSAH